MKKRRILIISLGLSASLLLSACSLNDVFRYVLSAPSINADGVIVSWNEVKDAGNYKIYNADTDTLIGETEYLSYTVDGIITDTKVYVKAYYKTNDIRFRPSEKSNIITIKTPKLRSPFISASKNSIVWEKVPGASSYKIYNNENDAVIGETKDLFYTFTNNDNPDLNVYVKAFYSDERLKDKCSSKSNVIKVIPDIVVVDVSKANSDSSYIIGDYVKKITFTGSCSTYSWDISTKMTSGTIDITFDNLNIKNDSGSCFLVEESNVTVNLTVEGNNSLSSKKSSAISVQNLNIKGLTNSSITLQGGSGNNGSSGRDGGQTSTGGANGGSGESGVSGSPALECQKLNVSNIKLIAYGGNGGNGGNGGSGGVGTTNNTAIFDRHVYGILGIEIQTIYHYDTAYPGGNGGNGGNGGDGGMPISFSSIAFDDASLLELHYGNGGRGGNGGKGGNGGRGHDYQGSNSGLSYLTCYDPGKGGNGGNGGNGGGGGRSKRYDLSISGTNVFIIEGTNGTGGTGGAGGSGGAGGFGGSTHDTANDHSAPDAQFGSSGHSGTNGGLN